jgi:hypothetical protein
MHPLHSIDNGEIWGDISKVVGFWGAFLGLVGQTGIFPVLCRYRPLKHFFPDIDGIWLAELHSNWPMIAKKAGLPDQNTAPTAAEIQIIARLFFVKINLFSVSQYSNSETKAVAIKKDGEDGKIRLYYVYDNTTKMPEDTDSSRHYGAAYLDLIRDSAGAIKLEGLYWTNRNWHKALNTAGTITLRRNIV